MPAKPELDDLTMWERFREFYPDGVEEAEDAYPPDDPKSPKYHSTHADLWDAREGK